MSRLGATRLRGVTGHAITRTFGSLLTTQILGAGFGFLFWVLAARTVPVEGVAAAGAAIAAMLLIATLANLGTGMLLMTELAGVPDERRRGLIEHALVGAGGVSAVLAVGFALVSPAYGETFRHAFPDLRNTGLFVVGTVATTVGIVMDRAVLGLRRPGSQTVRNLIAATARFPVVAGLVVLGVRGSAALVTAWVVALLIAQCVQLRLLRLPKAAGGRSWSRMRDDVRRYFRTAITHHALNISLGLAPQAMPLLAAGVLVPSSFASFTIAWTMCGALFVVPYAMAVTLLAVSSTDGGDLPGRIRVTMRSGLTLATLGALGALLLGGVVLHAYGAGYARDGTLLLQLLAAATVPLVIKDHYFVIQRLRQRRGRAAGLATVCVVVELSGALGGSMVAGAVGLVVGWLAALIAEACLMLPPVLTAMKRIPAGNPGQSVRVATGTPAR